MTYSDFAQILSYFLAVLVLIILYFTVRASVREAQYHRRLREMQAQGQYLESLVVESLDGEAWRGWTGASFELFDDNLIGRGPDADIRLGHNTVSVRHARIFRQGASLYIEDLGSKNGVVVNGGRMAQDVRWKLEDGDQIRLGRVYLRVHLVAQT